MRPHPHRPVELRSSHDVSAVLLTIGEESTERALASIESQTLPVSEIVVVEGVTPAHRAVNTGAGRVRTRFFVQVDADMVLDAFCVEALSRCSSEHVGVVIGHLRDPVRERILGVKLFRTECFERLQYPDTVCASTDFAAALEGTGWGRCYALRRDGQARRRWHTFGEHWPRYDSHEYTFQKFLIEGARCRYRRAEGRFKFMLNELRASSHPAALLATIALAHGLFVPEENDLRMPGPPSEDSIFLAGFLNGCCVGSTPAAALRREGAPAFGFQQGYVLGSWLRRKRDAPTFVGTLENLRQETSMDSILTLVGLCHGLFDENGSEARAENAFAHLAPLLAHADGSW